MSKDTEDGDNEFEKFLNEDDGGDESLSVLIDAITHKMDSLSSVLTSTLNGYIKLKELEINSTSCEDPVKKDLRNFIGKLICLSLQTFNQFDYVMISDEAEDGDTDDK